MPATDHILIIDNDPSSRETLKSILKEYRLSVAHSDEETLEDRFLRTETAPTSKEMVQFADKGLNLALHLEEIEKYGISES